jgi:hypothetical protein
MSNQSEPLLLCLGTRNQEVSSSPYSPTLLLVRLDAQKSFSSYIELKKYAENAGFIDKWKTDLSWSKWNSLYGIYWL